MNVDEVIVVNEKDEVLGYTDKMEAHRKGILHRAISVFIFNTSGEWLLQKRASHKYHSSDLWSNTACTHPLKDETELEAANRRLNQEMGMTATLKKVFDFQYKAHLDNELIENELDHIFVGITDEEPVVNPEEVSNFGYLSTEELESAMNKHPENFTEWFKLLFDRVNQEISKQ